MKKLESMNLFQSMKIVFSLLERGKRMTICTSNWNYAEQAWRNILKWIMKSPRTCCGIFFLMFYWYVLILFIVTLQIQVIGSQFFADWCFSGQCKNGDSVKDFFYSFLFSWPSSFDIVSTQLCCECGNSSTCTFCKQNIIHLLCHVSASPPKKIKHSTATQNVDCPFRWYPCCVTALMKAWRLQCMSPIGDHSCKLSYAEFTFKMHELYKFRLLSY